MPASLPSLAELFPPALQRRIEALGARFQAIRAKLGQGRRAQAGLRGRQDMTGHSAYVPGDDLRDLDWAAFGRMGKLYVRQFAREEESVVTIVLDTSASMGTSASRKRVGSCHLAAALAQIALADKHQVEVLHPGGNLRIERASGMPQVYAHLHASLALADSSPAQQEHAFSRWIERSVLTGKRPRHTLVISDLLEDSARAQVLVPLLQAGRRLSLIMWLSPNEHTPTPRGRVALQPSEGNAPEALRFDMNEQACSLYRRELNKHVQAWREALVPRGAAFELVTSDTPLEALLLRSLPASGVV